MRQISEVLPAPHTCMAGSEASVSAAASTTAVRESEEAASNKQQHPALRDARIDSRSN